MICLNQFTLNVFYVKKIYQCICCIIQGNISRILHNQTPNTNICHFILKKKAKMFSVKYMGTDLGYILTNI